MTQTANSDNTVGPPEPGTQERAPRHPVRVELTPGPGLRQVALNPADVLAWSGRAIDDAMDTIREMASRVRASVDALELRPTTVEVGFGIKFDASAHAVIAKASTEASISVTLSWEADRG